MDKHEWVGNQQMMGHGSFHNSLLEAWYNASPDNRDRLEESFPEFFTFKPD